MGFTETKNMVYKTPERINLREKMDSNSRSKERKRASSKMFTNEMEKKMLPFYSTSKKDLVDMPYSKLEENQGKVKVRFFNGF